MFLKVIGRKSRKTYPGSNALACMFVISAILMFVCVCLCIVVGGLTPGLAEVKHEKQVGMWLNNPKCIYIFNWCLIQKIAFVRSLKVKISCKHHKIAYSKSNCFVF